MDDGSDKQHPMMGVGRKEGENQETTMHSLWAGEDYCHAGQLDSRGSQEIPITGHTLLQLRIPHPNDG